MLSADATDNSSSPVLFDSDGLYDDDYLDNFSIDIGDLYAILDEDPQQQPNSNNSTVTTEGFQFVGQASSHFNPEIKSQAESTTDLEDSREKGCSLWNLGASGSERVTGFGFHNESGCKHNGITDRGGFHALPNSDTRNFCPIPAQDSSNELRPSCPNNNYPLAPFGGSSGSFFTVSFDQTPLQTNMKDYSVRGEGINGAGFTPFPVATENGFYFNSGKEVRKPHEHETAFQPEHEEFKPNGIYSSSISKLQNGEAGSSYFLSLGNFHVSGEIQESSSAYPDSTVDDGNMYSSSVYSYRDPAAVPHIVKPEAYTFDTSNATCDGSISCLTLLRDSSSDAEIGLPHTILPQFQHGNSENLNRRECHLLPPQVSCRTFDGKMHTKEASPDNSLTDVSITDLDAPLPDELYSEYHSDDSSLMSESSTDSSRNSTSCHADSGMLYESKHLVSGSDNAWPSKPKSSFEDEMGDRFLKPQCTQHDNIKGVSIAAQRKPSTSSINVEDPDICILDDISDPVCPQRALLCTKPYPMSQHPEISNFRYHGIGGMGLRPDDERLTFRLALQDLSQPKCEASPPDGVLAVPLLRHQRIALSWMVQKETANMRCSGGILADDQGLGKTVSTIALILMERSPSVRSTVVKEDEFEALDLDDDDDEDGPEVSMMKHPRNSMTTTVKRKKPVMVVKSRPAAGTLVVCPTSVLRQWAEELQTKVTSKANLSFLVYHGSNRTKDPHELAKYDVVLTTYAIVSMEVPKQPLVDKNDEEKGKQDAFSALDSKKRKDPPTSRTKNQKGRSPTDGALLESAARPLGRVGWFRVILDEAQSIKNYRTQVARACWGLRAKRRWCLSGTPIQNAVDDLYSYFRFLRYEPYAVYKSFCSLIKVPISRNPSNGYKKLQAVLRTIMLRRTKGTTLDGKPIITLPPKMISLKKVDFSLEERSFYSTLEEESRQQFMEYEDAGTVKQNYVNILLMLLRLRQACDHPLLVKGCDSNSSQKSSMETAKKLPREKKIVLLSCLEVSLAICTICNDPPEDAVVTICGHVFCNQCICEHLTTEENICPSPNCKVQLRAASVFSKGTLKRSLSDELDDACCSGTSVFEMGDKHKKSEDNWSSYSTKIKAALEILQSLPKSQLSLKNNFEKSDGGSSHSSVDTANSVSERSSMDLCGIGNTNPQRCSKIEISEKAIVFSQWTRMLDLLEGPLKASSVRYRRLDGTMSIAAREKAIKDFNTLPEVTVIIMSLKAASLGLNLVAANHVLLLDLWWNPTTEDQAIDRAHRIGQTRPVTVSRLTVQNTVEDKILSLQEKKREMVASAFGEDESGSRQTRLTVEDLRYLFTA